MSKSSVIGSTMVTLVLIFAATAHAEDKPKAEPAKAAAAKAEDKAAAPAQADALEPFRKLAGDWVGSAGEGDDKHELTISYRVVGAGSAVVEEMFKGTPHEMVTMYHLDGDTVMLTHYCAAQNQPRMKAVKSEKPNEVKFEFAGGTNIDPAKTKHMHGLLMRFVSDNELQAEWDHFDAGKSTGVVKFSMKRKTAN